MNEILKELNARFDGTDASAMKLAYTVAHRFSGCRLCGVGKGVGAIVVKEGRILAYGYNGTVDRMPPCTKETCIRLTRQIPHATRRDECYGDCAEKRAFLNAYQDGVSLRGSVLYVTKSPCVSCCKLLINLGIDEVVFDEMYSHSEFSFELLARAKVAYRQISLP